MAGGNAQGLGKQGNHGLVGRAGLGRLGDGDFQAAAVGADDAVARSAGDDLDGQEHAAVLFNQWKGAVAHWSFDFPWLLALDQFIKPHPIAREKALVD